MLWENYRISKSSLTFAPKLVPSGLEILSIKDDLQKRLSEGAGAMAFEGGWNKVKLYFILGLDRNRRRHESNTELANDIAVRYYRDPKDRRNGKCQITISISFSAKPFTFQAPCMI